MDGKERIREKIKKEKILLIVCCIAIVLLAAGDWVLSVMIYNENFNKRFEKMATAIPLALDDGSR